MVFSPFKSSTTRTEHERTVNTSDQCRSHQIKSHSQTRQYWCSEPAPEIHRLQTWKLDLISSKRPALDGRELAVPCADSGFVAEGTNEVTGFVGVATAQRCIRHVISVEYENNGFV